MSVILVLVALCASMVGLFSSSITGTARVNLGAKAEYLAQGGYRYAAGEYKHAGETESDEWDKLTARVDRLATLDDETVALSDGDGNVAGRFTIQVYPYWFRTDEEYDKSDNPVTIDATAPGTLPPGYKFPATGSVKIGSVFVNYTQGQQKKDSDTVSFKVENLPGGARVKEWICFAFKPSEPQTVARDGDLVLSSLGYADYKDIFPERNGQFEVDGDTYYYRERKQGSVKLSGITTDDGEMPLQINSDRYLVLNQQTALVCKGNAGSGPLSSERTIEFNVPVMNETFDPSGTTENLDLSHPEEPHPVSDHDTFFNLDHWDQSKEELDKGIRERMARPGYDEKDPLSIHTVFGHHDDYVTFQNFNTVDPDADYSAILMEHGLTENTLRGVWGTAADNVYVVGDGGVLLHYDGEDWTLTHPRGWTGDLNAIWGIADDQRSCGNDKGKFVVAGDGGKVMVYQSGRWHDCPHYGYKSSQNLYALWGTRWNHFDAYGQDRSNPYNWGSCSPQRRLQDAEIYWNYEGLNFRSLWATEYYYGRRWDQNILCGNRRFQTRFWNGRHWVYGWVEKGFIFHEFFPDPVYFSQKLAGVWGSSFENVYTVGENGSMWRNTSGKINKDRKWVQQTGIPIKNNLNGIYGIGEDYIYAVGDDGTIIFNGGSGWEKIPTDNLPGLGDLYSVWSNEKTGLFAVGEHGKVVSLGYPENDIAYYILPLKKNEAFREKWESGEDSGYLSYAVQVKQVWGSKLDYAASGICFRWHESSAHSGKFEGYGISFMRYSAFSDGVNDFIPDSMKPAYRDTVSKNDRPLVVLWKQYVKNGNEKRIWLAYKDLSDDSRLVTGNKIFRDLSTLIVRIDEKRINGSRVNDINIYYANASKSAQNGDTRCDNTIREEYNPTFADKKFSGSIQWPDHDNWTALKDYFTLVSNVSTAVNPVDASCSQVENPVTGGKVYKCENYWIVNPSPQVTGVQLLNDRHTIRSGTFTSPEEGEGFGTQEERCEVALHVFGGVGKSSQVNKLAGFADFAVQLESNTGGSGRTGGFGRLR
ncbi:MAG: hypothetical protein GY737_00870 [Desulfobacteraceae bacterium]|nr:hypothetical protein [Desulfobacteraceae bacterium]